MSSCRNKYAFSPDGEYFACSGPDCRLKIWETASNSAKEYFPSSDLSATCTALAWISCSKDYSNSPKKSRRAKSVSAVDDLQLLAIGTDTGKILLYDFHDEVLHAQLVEGHTGDVNDICRYPETDSLYSCSSDRHIVSWDARSGKVKSKWKASETAVSAICVIDSNNMLSASDSILWWDINKQTAIKRFCGHNSEVFQLLAVNTSKNSIPCYFLSSAFGDRVINAWHLSENNSTSVVACFMVPDEPERMEVSKTSAKDQPLLVSVVTKAGALHLFQHVLNGKKQKPLQPKASVHIVSEVEDSGNKPHPIPILSAKFSEGLESCVLAYGSIQKPTFEKVDISECPKRLHLTRNVCLPSDVPLNNEVYLIKGHNKSNVVKSAIKSMKKASSRKTIEADTMESPVEDALNSLELRIPSQSDTSEPTMEPNSQIHILVQGLRNKDGELLNTILQNRDVGFIRCTLKKLPIQCIELILKELHQRLCEDQNLTYATWMREVLQVHLPHISHKECEYLNPIEKFIEANQANDTIDEMHGLLGLTGCLTILTEASIRADSTLNTSELLPADLTDELDDLYSHSESEEDSESLSEKSESSDDDLMEL